MSGRIPRAFVAVVPPAAVLDAVARVVHATPMPDGWRPTPRAQWHLTLQFLGAVDDADALGAALRDAASGAGRPFAVQLAGAGAFPSARRAGVVWIGIGDGAAALDALAGGVSSALAPLGHVRDEERFHPHLTVARTRGRDRRDGRPVVAALGAAAGGGSVGEAWTVGEVVLFESRTRAEGAQHLVRGRFPLGARPGRPVGA